jgi:hypothetical protein
MSTRSLQSLLKDSTSNGGLGTHNPTRIRQDRTFTNASKNCFVGAQNKKSDEYYPKTGSMEVPNDSCYR